LNIENSEVRTICEEYVEMLERMTLPPVIYDPFDFTPCRRYKGINFNMVPGFDGSVLIRVFNPRICPFRNKSRLTTIGKITEL
jgi:hypothetical protein